ncbi:MAG: type I DNA topoisomerase [Bacteroidales bacterium]
MGENLVIVESPAKAKTIEKFLGKDYIVKSSFGHIRDLSKKNLGIDVEHDFEPNYVISQDKKKIVTELKAAAKKAKIVWIASDEDREGEAIAWHLYECLGLKPENTKRIVFHEITKTAILHAIDNPRTINLDLVNAQQARRVLDRLVGFELSPVLWKKIKPSLSAGRVQSAALRLIVDREREIIAFKPHSYYRIDGNFLTDNDNKSIKGTIDQKIKDINTAKKLLNEFNGAEFKIGKTETKKVVKKPAPPFTTSSMQQEAGRKFGFSVSQTMSIAQHLYESGLITYMRTDSTNLSKLALSAAKETITDLYGEKYSKTRQYKTHSKGAQEAHEAIRPTSFANIDIKGAARDKRLYQLIWKRAIASQMSDASLEKTTLKILNNKNNEKFTAQGEQILFDGFLKVYIESKDDENNEERKNLLPLLSEGQNMLMQEIRAQEKYTQHPYRYTEASLVKKMEELGIGRPSTYAPTITTLHHRGYIVKGNRIGQKMNISSLLLSDAKLSEKSTEEIIGSEKGKLCPEDIGIIVTDYLIENFDSVVDYGFTAEVEESFDTIAAGKAPWNKDIKDFYSRFHKKIETISNEKGHKDTSRTIGIDPKTNKTIIARMGKFGPLVQLGESDDKDKKFAALPKGVLIENVTIEQALQFFKLPRILGNLEDLPIKCAIGRFGPYINYNKEFISLPKNADPYTFTLEEAIQLIKDNKEKKIKSKIKDFEEEDIHILIGRYGPYIKQAKKNYKIPKGTTPEELTLEQCQEIIEKQLAKKKKK